MLPHDWIVEEVDCGNLGVEDFWKCRRCGAWGGGAFPPWNRSIPRPFINERIGGPLDLSDDCEEAAVQIKNYREARNIAVYGGSFNPVHWGHVVSAINCLINNPIIDEVLVAPCFQQTGKDLLDFHHRFNMCQLAFQQTNKVTVSDVEFHLGDESYTYRLVQHLKDKNPNWNLRFIIGADLKESYKKWKNSEVIDRIAPPLVVPRPGFSDGPGIDISSTKIRNCFKLNRTDFLERVLPAPVFSYIVEHQLYT